MCVCAVFLRMCPYGFCVQSCWAYRQDACECYYICVHMVTIYVSICLCTELLSIETRRADIPRVFSLIEINQHVESVNYVYVYPLEKRYIALGCFCFWKNHYEQIKSIIIISQEKLDRIPCPAMRCSIRTRSSFETDLLMKGSCSVSTLSSFKIDQRTKDSLRRETEGNA